jgi:hypothetical protein
MSQGSGVMIDLDWSEWLSSIKQYCNLNYNRSAIHCVSAKPLSDFSIADKM